MYAYASSNSRSDTVTLDFRNNGADGNQTIQYTAGQTGFKEDTTHTDSLIADDDINWERSNGGGTGTLSMDCLGCILHSSNNEFLLVSTGAHTLGASATIYAEPAGGMQSLSTEGDAAGAWFYPQFTFTCKELTVHVNSNSNAAGENYDVTLRDNLGNSALTVNYNGSQTGVKSDSTHIAEITLGTDELDYMSVNSGTGSVNTRQIHCIGYTTGASPQTITLSGLSSGEAFGTASVQPGAVAISLTSIVTAEAFGSASLEPGAVAISLTAIASAEAVGTLQLNSIIDLILSAIPSAEAVGDPVLSPGEVDLILSGLPSEEAFGALALSGGAMSLLLSGIGSAEAFGVTALQPGSVVLLPSGIPSAQAFGDVLLLPGAVVISPSAIPSLEAIGNILLIGGDQIIGYLLAEASVSAALAGTGEARAALAGSGTLFPGHRGRVVMDDV